jgi:hypothetical protein
MLNLPYNWTIWELTATNYPFSAYQVCFVLESFEVLPQIYKKALTRFNSELRT